MTFTDLVYFVTVFLNCVVIICEQKLVLWFVVRMKVFVHASLLMTRRIDQSDHLVSDNVVNNDDEDHTYSICPMSQEAVLAAVQRCKEL